MTTETTTYSQSQRQHERFAHLILGQPLPEPPAPARPRGMSKQEWRAHKPTLIETLRAATRLDPDIERAIALRDEWRGRAGTPETLERAARSHQGALARLCRAGEISANQLAAAEQIRVVVESLHADVALPIASWETRVDGGCGSPDRALIEHVRDVRFEAAYTRWRASAVGPIGMLLDMIVNDIGYSVAASTYRIGPKRAKRLLVDALDLWWTVRGLVGREIDDAAIAAVQGEAFG